ncbi:MAG: CD225/dispanin family protein [Muribaculaceae bacterium]
MKYFIAVNGQQRGPFEVTELIANGLTPTTLVWTEGMPEWKPANTVAELTPLFQGTTPPAMGYYPNQQSNAWNMQQVPAQPKTWLVESILVTLFCCLPLGIVGIIKAANVSSLYNAGRYQEAEQSSQEAGKWTKWGFFIGLVGCILYFLFLVMMMVVGNSTFAF